MTTSQPTITLGLGLPLRAEDVILKEHAVRRSRDQRQHLIATRVRLVPHQHSRLYPHSTQEDVVHGTHIRVTGRRGGPFALWPLEILG